MYVWDILFFTVSLSFSNTYTNKDTGGLNKVYVSPENVVKVLSGLNSSSAAGPDGLHTHLLKACSVALSLPFHLLFERSRWGGAT